MTEHGANGSRPEFRFTRDVLKLIRRRVRARVAGPDIATELGCDYGTLRNVCAKHGISLRAQPGLPEPVERKPVRLNGIGAPRNEFCFPLSHHAKAVGQREALLRGVSLEVLAAVVFERIAQDDLFKAVLDD